LESPADIKRLKKIFNLGKIVRITIAVAHGYRKMKNIMHHAGLKNILEKLIVVNSPTCFDLENSSLTHSMGVSVETLQYLAFAPKKHGNNYLIVARLSLLDSESELFQTGTKECHNGIAMLVRPCTRIDGIGKLLKERHDQNAEFGRRRRLREVHPIDHR
jgi:hypothetical protein